MHAADARRRRFHAAYAAAFRRHMRHAYCYDAVIAYAFDAAPAELPRFHDADAALIYYDAAIHAFITRCLCYLYTSDAIC